MFGIPELYTYITYESSGWKGLDPLFLISVCGVPYIQWQISLYILEACWLMLDYQKSALSTYAHFYSITLSCNPQSLKRRVDFINFHKDTTPTPQKTIWKELFNILSSLINILKISNACVLTLKTKIQSLKFFQDCKSPGFLFIQKLMFICRLKFVYK